MEKVSYFNILLDIHTTDSAIETCKQFLNNEGCKRIFFINAHCFNVAQKDPDYLKILNECEMLLNDGSGIKLGSWLAGVNIKANMNGTDFVPHLLKLAQAEQKKVFLLGTTQARLEDAEKKIIKTYPGINLCGSHNGFFGAENSNQIVRKINQSKADILIVGMGVPYQEKWVSTYYSMFTSVKIALAGGAIIDFLSGHVPRAPRWMQKLGIEWFFRFLLEPGRMMKRYFVGNFAFIARVILMRIRGLHSRK